MANAEPDSRFQFDDRAQLPVDYDNYIYIYIYIYIYFSFTPKPGSNLAEFCC